jgi:hypothetical protein
MTTTDQAAPDRTGWDSRQWAEDARRIFFQDLRHTTHQVSVPGLLNQHIYALLAELEAVGPPTTIVYEIDCPHCDDEGTAVIRALAFGQPEEDGAIHVDVGMSVAQSTFECTKCGCSVYTGDVDGSTEDDECPAEGSDDEGEDFGDEDDDQDEVAL